MGQTLQANVPASAAGASAIAVELGDVPVFEGVDNYVSRVTFTPQTAVSAEGGTNFATIQVRDVTQGSKVLASVNIGAVALVAEQEVDLTLASDVRVNQKDVLDVYVFQTGTGGAVPAGKVNAELE